MKTRKLKFGSVCSGIEAASAAWHPLGWECQFVAEIESFPSRLLKVKYPLVPNYGDMTKYEGWPKHAIDVLVGGTPCQSFSVAGLRKGLADPRGNLALTFLGIIDKYAPTWVVWENVPGVFSSWSDGAAGEETEECREIGRVARRLAADLGIDDEAAGEFGAFEEVDQSNDLDCFTAGLGELGYGWALASLDAQYFGVAQRRERVFVVGHIGGQWERAAAVLFDRESLCGNPAPRRETGEGVAPSIAARTRGGGGLGTDAECDGAVIPIQVEVPISIDSEMNAGLDLAGPLKTVNKGGSGELAKVAVPIGIDGGEVGFALRSNASHSGDKGDGGVNTTMVLMCPEISKPLGCHALSKGRGSDLDCTTYIPEVLAHGQGNAERVKDGSPSLTCNHEAPIGFIPIAFPSTLSATQRVRSENVSAAIGAGNVMGVAHEMAVRRLTPRECERLQGFPDDYTLVLNRGKAAADGPRYKALGNSMAVPVMRWIGERILLVEGLATKEHREHKGLKV